MQFRGTVSTKFLVRIITRQMRKENTYKGVNHQKTGEVNETLVNATMLLLLYTEVVDIRIEVSSAKKNTYKYIN